jgi:hypothetical protein
MYAVSVMGLVFIKFFTREMVGQGPNVTLFAEQDLKAKMMLSTGWRVYFILVERLLRTLLVILLRTSTRASPSEK